MPISVERSVVQLGPHLSLFFGGGQGSWVLLFNNILLARIKKKSKMDAASGVITVFTGKDDMKLKASLLQPTPHVGKRRVEGSPARSPRRLTTCLF